MSLNYIGHNQWDGLNIDKFYDKLISGTYDKIILFCQNEWQWHAHSPEYWSLIQDHCKKIKQPIHIITASHQHLYPVEVENTIVHWWDTYWIGKTYETLINTNQCQKISIDPCEKIDYNFHYISMNNRAHPHRCLLIDLLAKHDMLKYGAVSLHENSVIYKWKYFDFKPMLLEPEWLTNKIQYKLPSEYYTAFAQLVSESSGDTIMLSEKTAIPLFLGKPFLVAGQRHFHKFLQGLGFQLFDEIFDYSFDGIEDEQTRYEMIVENFKKLSSIPLSKLPDLQYKIAHKLEFNKRKAKEIVYDKSLYPEIATEVINYYHETGIMIDRRLIEVEIELERHRNSEI